MLWAAPSHTEFLLHLHFMRQDFTELRNDPQPEASHT